MSSWRLKKASRAVNKLFDMHFVVEKTGSMVTGSWERLMLVLSREVPNTGFSCFGRFMSMSINDDHVPLALHVVNRFRPYGELKVSVFE